MVKIVFLIVMAEGSRRLHGYLRFFNAYGGIGCLEGRVEKNQQMPDYFKVEVFYFIINRAYLFFVPPLRCQPIWFLISLRMKVLLRLKAISVSLGSCPLESLTNSRAALMASFISG